MADTNGDGITGDVGDQVSYAFTLRNSGNAPLANVQLGDALAGLSALAITWPDPAAPNTLAVGAQATATATYVLTAADVSAGQVVNNATASADPAGGVATPGASASVQTPTTAPRPALTLGKTAAVADSNGNTRLGDPGDVVTFTLTATNTGDVALSGVQLADALPGLSPLTVTWPNPAQPGVLAVGAVATATATYTLAAADAVAGTVANTATVTAASVPGVATPPSATATASVAAVPTPVAAPTAVPVDSPWALLALGGAVAALARRRIAPRGLGR